MNILITGGAGFVGTNLIKKLLTLNHQVVSIDNYNTGLKSNHQDGCLYIEDDIRTYDYSDLKVRPDFIFHMAAIARIQPSFNNPVDYFNTNANGTLNLLKFCSDYNIPILYAGSSSKHSGKFKNPYTFSKSIGEEIVELFQTHYNTQASIARFYNVYGDYQLTEGGYTTLIGRWISNLENNIQCEIYGDGEQRRDFTHVDDIVDALVLIMDKEAYGYEFELGRGKNYSVNEVADMFDLDPVYKDAKQGEARNTLNTSIVAKEVLGWDPQIELPEYLKSIL
jgi:UDP-glucose 4-epimerase